MKVYLFYAKTSDIRPGDLSERGKELYAFTTQKKLAKKFKSDRNMNIFSEKFTKMTKDEYRKFAAANRECVLEDAVLHTASKERYPESLVYGFDKLIKRVNIILTFLEKQSIHEAKETYLFYKYVDNDTYRDKLITPYIFKEKILYSLDIFEYSKVYRSSIFPYLDFEYSERDTDNMICASYSEMKGVENLDFGAPEFWIDELALFVELYSHLLKN